MDALCLLVAGVLRTSLPGPEFTLAWQHSVEKIEWEERYRVEPGRLRLVAVRVRGHGAGMEPPPEATLRDGAWSWSPGSTVAELRLARTSATADYTLCSASRCRSLGEWVDRPADDGVVVLRACAGASGR